MAIPTGAVQNSIDSGVTNKGNGPARWGVRLGRDEREQKNGHRKHRNECGWADSFHGSTTILSFILSWPSPHRTVHSIRYAPGLAGALS